MLDFIQLYSGLDLLIVSVAYIVAILIALTCHEFSHAYVSYKQGDLTAKSQGRLSLNPLNHIDPIGFLCLLLFGFGWAKPVQVNDLKFKNYRRGIFLTSISGIVTNFLLSFIFSGIYVAILPWLFSTAEMTNIQTFLNCFLTFSITINLGLAFFNALPIPPLDGFNAITAFTRYDNKVIRFLRKYSYIILLILIISSLVELVLGFAIGYIYPAFMQFWGFILWWLWKK